MTTSQKRPDDVFVEAEGIPHQESSHLASEVASVTALVIATRFKSVTSSQI